ncbi:hypothetical protein [Paraburkholderia kirstenboschensis]|uniref:hypothetical protein n=1 Tax=Paraburkholderia kirstenboschensis TaxID=1245436 RepID=UPI0013E3C835|nr:hypothetical protein [Paraburkholderia kirstenboschensis]
MALVIQAVDAEICRLRELPDEQTVAGDDVRLMDFVHLAAELKDLYKEACAEDPELPSYDELVTGYGDSASVATPD